MDPNAFSGDSVNIFNFDMSGNQLTEIDVTNLVMDKLYCNINYERNKFQEIGNKLGWKVNISRQYGSGMVNVGQNPPMHFPNYELLGFSVEQFPKLFKIMRNTNFYFGSNTYVCDCNLEPVLRYVHIWKPDYSFVFPNFPDFNCSEQGPNPGINALNFLQREERNKLVCSLDNDPNCPSMCECYDQPSLDRVVVNCTGQKFDRSDNLEVMPKGIGHNLELYFRDTGLKTFTLHEYFERVSVIDLSNNSLREIASLFSGNLSSFKNLRKLYISNHNLKSLPESLKQLDANALELGEAPIDCDCQNIWIGEWRSIYNVNKSINPLFCKVGERILPAEDVTREFLRCDESRFQWTWLIVLTSVIMTLTCVITGLLIFFKHEIQILFRSLRLGRKVNTANNIYFDVYISYDINEFDIRTWVLRGLRRQLIETGLRVYDAVLDTLPGSIREEVISVKMAQSKHIIIVLSEAYINGDDPFCAQEFKGAVNLYLRDRSKELLLINFDNIQSSEVSDPYMKGFLRLGKYLSFADRHENIIRKVNKIVGKKYG